MNSKILGNLASAGAYTIFGLNIIFCKDIANASVVPPVALFTIRALGASALFWLLSLFLPAERVDKGDFWKIALASVLGLFLPQLTFLSAITMTTSIDASILSALAPIFTMIFSAIFMKEPLTWKKVLGVAISFCGVMILIFNSASAGHGAEVTKPLGVVLMLMNGLTFAAYLGIFKPLISKYSVVTFMKWMFLVSVIVSLPLSAQKLLSVDYASISGEVWSEIGFLVFFATFVAYFLIPVGQKNVRPTIVSMYTYLQPLIAAVVSVLTGLDVLDWKKCAAALLIFSGVAAVNRSRARS